MKPSTKHRSSQKSVTLADVAQVAGVSKITASRALSNPKIVSPEVQLRVREAVAKTGYVPNLLAGGLKSNRSRLVACLVPTISSGSAFMFAVQAMTEAFAQAGYQVMLGQRGYDHVHEEMLVDAVIARRPDGIVVMGIMQSEVARQRLKATGIPVVETWDLTNKPIDMLVGFSHTKVGEAIAEYLYGKGRRRLAMISADEPRGIARGKGFVDAACRLGLVNNPSEVPTFVVGAPTKMKYGRQGLRTLIERYPDIDALYCASDLVALGALLEAGKQGIAVPEQLAVIGFGDLEFAADAEPGLSTVRIDNVEIGRRAASMIIERINGEHSSLSIIDLGFTVVQRESA